MPTIGRVLTPPVREQFGSAPLPRRFLGELQNSWNHVPPQARGPGLVPAFRTAAPDSQIWKGAAWFQAPGPVRAPIRPLPTQPPTPQPYTLPTRITAPSVRIMPAAIGGQAQAAPGSAAVSVRRGNALAVNPAASLGAVPSPVNWGEVATIAGVILAAATFLK